MSKGTPKRRTVIHGFTLSESLGILTILVALAVLLVPVFRRSHSYPIGAVRDSSGKPVPGAVLRFRASSGRVLATITADKNGEFRWRRLDDLSGDSVDGFQQGYSIQGSGSSNRYVFTPVETRIATFCDDSGRPLPGLSISFGPDHNTWQHHVREPYEQVSDRNGTIQIHRASESTYFEFQSLNPNFIVERFQRFDDGHTVHYAVTLTQPGTITGCLWGKDGQPLPGYQVFATISPDLDRFDRWYADNHFTGPTGRFSITNLRPRVYYVSIAPARGYHALLSARRVTLTPGQTATVNLRANGTDDMKQAPHAQ